MTDRVVEQDDDAGGTEPEHPPLPETADANVGSQDDLIVISAGEAKEEQIEKEEQEQEKEKWQKKLLRQRCRQPIPFALSVRR